MAKPGEKFKTFKTVFDNYTLRNLHRLEGQGHFDEIIGPISVGKEANVFSAVNKAGDIVCVKIYRLETCDFNRMFDYIKSDPRFKMRRSKRQVIFLWAQREYRNLLKAREAGVRVPTPNTIRDNILIMELIGKKKAAPMLKDKYPSDPQKFFDEVIKGMKKLYKAEMVHGDLSSFNILNLDEKPVFIDFSQATVLEDQNAEDWLERDVKNVCQFFRKLGVDADVEKVLKKIKK